MLDLLIVNAQIVDVVRSRTYTGWLGIKNGLFQYVEEDPTGTPPSTLTAQKYFDAEGARLSPGLIDAHMHIESSLLTPAKFSEAVLPHGTTTVLTDPHELANVLGIKGVTYTLQASRDLPLRVYVSIPSCIPATSTDLETALGHIDAEDIHQLAQDRRVLALGEVMDYQGLAAGVTKLPKLIRAAQQEGLLIEGHTPTLGGMVLSDYTAYGILSDHTLSTPEKLYEQLSKGYTVMVQEKSLNVQVVKAILELPDRSRVLLVTDDVMPNRLQGGHLSRLINIAISYGWLLEDAIAAASLRPAMYLGLRQLGLLAPGRCADFCILEEGEGFRVKATYVSGQMVAERGECLLKSSEIPVPRGGEITRPIASLASLKFDVPNGRHLTHIIHCNERNTFTELEQREVDFQTGWPTDHDLNVVAVFSRQGDGPPGLALLKGFHLESGAFASSLAHDSHNLLCVGKEQLEMQKALQLIHSEGGMVFTQGGNSSYLPLDVVGLVSSKPLPAVATQFEAIERALRAHKVTHLNPILFLSILSLTVSPTVKVSDLGLIDVEQRKLLPLFL